jgi:hypothetical protein
MTEVQNVQRCGSGIIYSRSESGPNTEIDIMWKDFQMYTVRDYSERNLAISKYMEQLHSRSSEVLFAKKDGSSILHQSRITFPDPDPTCPNNFRIHFY